MFFLMYLSTLHELQKSKKKKKNNKVEEDLVDLKLFFNFRLVPNNKTFTLLDIIEIGSLSSEILAFNLMYIKRSISN